MTTQTLKPRNILHLWELQRRQRERELEEFNVMYIKLPTISFTYTRHTPLEGAKDE